MTNPPATPSFPLLELLNKSVGSFSDNPGASTQVAPQPVDGSLARRAYEPLEASASPEAHATAPPVKFSASHPASLSALAATAERPPT